MKKYLFNYFIVGAMAVLTVVGLQSFTGSAVSQKVGANVGQSCTDVIWYRVQTTANITCPNYQTVNASNLELHDANSANPLIDMEDFNLSTEEAKGEFNCEDEDTFTCAVAYPADAGNFTELDGKWVPQTTPVCVICRP